MEACIQLGYKTSQYTLNQNSIIDIQDKLTDHDFIFIALHGSFGEDGSIQSILSEMNIPYNGSNEKSSKICFDKAETKKIVIGEGIDSPKYYHTSSNSCNDHFDFSAEKYVVKPNAQGSSVGFNIVNDLSKINDVIDIALDFDRSVLIEEFINGREITVSVLGEESLPVIEIKPKSGVYDYNSKYIIGETDYICPAEMNSVKYRSVQDCALKIHKMLSCDVYSRVDFKFFDNKFYFLEINTLPGMTKTSLFPKAAKQHGLSFKKLIEKIIKLSLEK